MGIEFRKGCMIRLSKKTTRHDMQQTTKNTAYDLKCHRIIGNY